MESNAFIALFVGSLFAIVAGKDASTQTTEKPDILQDIKNLEVLDYLRGGAFVIGILVPLLYGRRTFLLALAVGTALIGCSQLFFPRQVLQRILVCTFKKTASKDKSRLTDLFIVFFVVF